MQSHNYLSYWFWPWVQWEFRHYRRPARVSRLGSLRWPTTLLSTRSSSCVRPRTPNGLVMFLICTAKVLGEIFSFSVMKSGVWPVAKNSRIFDCAGVRSKSWIARLMRGLTLRVFFLLAELSTLRPREVQVILDGVQEGWPAPGLRADVMWRLLMSIGPPAPAHRGAL
jgi:hypothetical protein